MSVKSQERYQNKVSGKVFDAPRKGVCGRCSAPYNKGDGVVEYQNHYPRKIAHVECVYYPVEIRTIDTVPQVPSKKGGDIDG